MDIMNLKKNDNVVIIGNEENKPRVYPLDKNSDVWVKGEYYEKLYGTSLYQCAKVDAIFDMRQLKLSPGFNRIEYQKLLKKLEYPIISINNNGYKDFYEYPLANILARFDRKYFSCSECFMIALAILMDYKKITLRNIYMVYLDRYVQKYSVEYWLGVAEGRGIELDLEPESGLLSGSKMFGYDMDNLGGVLMKIAIDGQVAQIKETLNFQLEALKQTEIMIESFNMLSNNKDVFMEHVIERQGIRYRKDNNPNSVDFFDPESDFDSEIEDEDFDQILEDVKNEMED